MLSVKAAPKSPLEVVEYWRQTGRNKNLRKKIGALREVAEKHQEKIRLERKKSTPNESYIQ